MFAPVAAGEVSDEARRASLGAMTNLMCRGRKRGLAGVSAAQTLAKPARLPWMAAADAPQRPPAAAQRAEAGDRPHGVFLAGWTRTHHRHDTETPPRYMSKELE